MKPTIGRIVIFKLAPDHTAQINRRRTTRMAIATAIEEGKWPLGSQAHIGDYSQIDEEYPMLIVKVYSSECINGQVFLDGNDVLWVTCVQEGRTAGTWHWPDRE